MLEENARMFNSMGKCGKEKMMPLLLNIFLQTKPEGGWYFVIKLSKDLTDTQKTLIHKYNLLGDCRRKEKMEKVAFYFLMTMDADYEFILSGEDDESAKPFIVFEIDVRNTSFDTKEKIVQDIVMNNKTYCKTSVKRTYDIPVEN